jgi:zinc/manganese transport system permease protein
MEIFFIILPALVFAIFLSIVAVPIGLKVVDKGIIFLDIAIAQIAVLGSIIASSFIFESHDVYFIQIFSILFSIIGALGFYLMGKIMVESKYLEALIGIVYIFVATISTLLLSIAHHNSDTIELIFSGKLLFLNYNELSIIITIYIIISWLIFKYKILNNNLLFYIIFGLVVSLAMPIVGIYFMFSSLIIPALLYKTNKNPIINGVIFSLLVIFLGVLLSIFMDYPSGLAIVITYVVFGSVIYIYRHTKYLIIKSS